MAFSKRSRRWSRREQRAVFRPPLALFVERLVLACEDDDAALPTTRILEVSYHHPAPLAGHVHDAGTELMGLVDAGGAEYGADEFVALEQLLVCGRPEVVHLLLLLVLLLLGVVVVVARRVHHHLNITATRMAGVVVRGGCFLLHRPGCVGCVEAFFYALLLLCKFGRRTRRHHARRPPRTFAQFRLGAVCERSVSCGDKFLWGSRRRRRRRVRP